MYRIVIIIIASLVCALFLSGCVSYQKFEDLQLENSKLNQEILLSRQQNEALAQELKQFRELSDFYYQSGMQLYTEKKYGEALEKFQTLVDRYPTSPHAAGSSEKIAEIRNLALNNYQKIIESVEGTPGPAGANRPDRPGNEGDLPDEGSGGQAPHAAREPAAGPGRGAGGTEGNQPQYPHRG